MDKKELLALKEDIENIKMEVSKLTGQKEALMKQLQTDWNCETLEEAEKKVKTMEKEISDLERQIEEGMKELEEKYELK